MGPHWGKSSITFSVNLLDPTLACIVPHPPYRLRNQKRRKRATALEIVLASSVWKVKREMVSCLLAAPRFFFASLLLRSCL